MIVRSAIVLTLAIVAPLGAQFDNLVTNDSGDRVYFSSSLRMRGSDQFDHRKLFVADDSGIRLHTERERRQITVPESTWPVSTYYSVEAAAISGDESVTGIIARRDCYGGSGCVPVSRYATTVLGVDYRGRMSVSRNGRFALFSSDGSLIPFEALFDLSRGDRLSWMGDNYGTWRYGRRRVSSNGTALIVSRTGLKLKRLDGSEKTLALPTPDTPTEAVIDDEGETVVYEAPQPEGAGRRLVRIDLASGASRLLATSTVPMQPCLSNDGQTVLYLSGQAESQQMFVIAPAGAQPRRLTNDPAGLAEIVLSGNGRVAYAASRAGRLFRLDLDTGIESEIIGRAVAVNADALSSPPYPVPGSAFPIIGEGLADSADSAAPPLPENLNGVEVLLDGSPIPLISVAPTRIVAQMPWDVAPGKHRFEVNAGINAIFETDPLDIEVADRPMPQFEPLGDPFRRSVSGQPYALSAHGDFSALLTADDPARPGEIIHLYMTGLGPVEPSVETGAPSPSAPPARVQGTFFCGFAPTGAMSPGQPAEVLFAGLAPVYAGYYQVSLRIPEDVETSYGDALLNCGFPDYSASAWIPLTSAR